MATQVPPLKGTAFTYEIALVSQADISIFQVNPTLAAGDVIVYKDGALDGNADNLPTAIGGSAVVTHTLSAAEMNADRIVVKYTDVAGAEWQDLLVTIFTVTSNQIDDLATEANIGAAGVSLTAIPWNAAWSPEVNTQVVDALNVDTYVEPGQGDPPATATLVQKISYLYKAFRNKITQTATALSLYNDAGDTVDQKATVSDDGTTYTRGEIGTGP